jgi:hypothetical protein
MTACALPYDCMRATAEATFFDTCRIGAVPVHTWGGPDTGQSVPVFGDALACGFQPMNKGEVQDGSQAPNFDAKLRLSLDIDVSRVDRVELTARHGSAIEPQLYSVEGDPERGPSAQVLNLKRITGKSTR